MEKFKTAIAALGTGLTYLLGSWDTALKVLVIFMILDYLTGLIKGAVTKKLSSNIGFNGIARKAVIFIILIVAVLLDRLLNNGEWIFRTLVSYYYIANEGISIAENAIIIGVPVPDKLRDIFAQIKDRSNSEVNEV